MSRRVHKRSRETKSPAPAAGNARLWLYGTLGCLLCVALAVWLFGPTPSNSDSPATAENGDERPPDGAVDQRRPGPEDAPRKAAARVEVALPEIARSNFRNSALDVDYVGSGECLECHREHYDSYLKTNHSRSLARVDVPREPPDGQFQHDLSGRSYSVSRAGDELHLRELITDTNGQEIVLQDFVPRYSLGSGNYARMYLIPLGDFLIEAPMTWYPRRDCWGMSAGYEHDPHQAGFSREIDAQCLFCHAGRVEFHGQASQLMKVIDPAIGCERCHGPGALHVKERQAGKLEPGAVDDSIVNLRHLSRARQEDVCSQCHLSGSADVIVRDRRLADFRPSLRLSDFRISYRIDRPDSAMTVSGQIEQMRLSRCYLNSEAMSCATCHNLHARPDDAVKVEYFRDKCLSCHAVDACGLSSEQRREREPNDYCVTCHMPRGPTDIPHFSFTHHRIGIHEPNPQRAKLNETDRLMPVVDESYYADLDRQRMLGLANDIFAGKLAGGLNDEDRYNPEYRQLSQVFAARAQQTLEKVRAQGLRDPEIELYFTRLFWRKDPERCISYALSTLSMPQAAPATRQVALYNLGTSYFDQRQFDRALPVLNELARIERTEITFMLLGICHQQNGNLAEAIRLFQAAIADSPDRADLHTYLASVYQKLGRAEEARFELERARLLTQRVPQPQDR